MPVFVELAISTLFCPIVLDRNRLILDLRHENKCSFKQRVKYENWKVALAYFAKASYMFYFDLNNMCSFILSASSFF